MTAESNVMINWLKSELQDWFSASTGGVLDKVLKSLSIFMEKMQKIKNKVKSAMVYPLVVMVMAGHRQQRRQHAHLQPRQNPPKILMRGGCSAWPKQMLLQWLW